MPDDTPDLSDFLSVAADFHLGTLETEQAHPKTVRLSHWAREDLAAGIEALREVDRDALTRLEERLGDTPPLRKAISGTLERGHRIFLCGCGATGRLSIALEILGRDGLLPGATEDNLIGFMAGGDAALIRSIERFEDRPEFGARQLRELGFGEGDLLIASTEGGETSFVIGATEAAAEMSTEAPFFLYGNPDDQLGRLVERSRRVLQDGRIRKINLAVGPMALSGSTRMQASTVLMAAIGFAMGEADFGRWRHWAAEELDWAFLAGFIEAEAGAYHAGEQVLYEPGPYGITVLTDTTERSPTFSLTPFEREGIEEAPSLCYLRIPDAGTAAEAWRAVLGRDLRPLEWGELRHLTGAGAMARFDFSKGVLERRSKATPQHRFRLSREPEGIRWRFRDLDHLVPVPAGIDFLGENLALKLLLNAHSTLVMGRLGRYEDNLMTYVAANNFKLIDRAIRYTRILLKRHHGLEPDYETVAKRLLEVRETLGPGEPIVVKTVEALSRSAPA